MSLLNRIAKRRFAIVSLADGVSVRLRSLIRSEQRLIEERTKDRPKFYNDCFLAMSIVNEDGEPEISLETALEGFFDQWDLRETQELLSTAIDLNYVRKDRLTVEDAVKNSNGTHG